MSGENLAKFLLNSMVCQAQQLVLRPMANGFEAATAAAAVYTSAAALMGSSWCWAAHARDCCTAWRGRSTMGLPRRISQDTRYSAVLLVRYAVVVY